jgi:UDP-N-acetylglucosamine 2-epimerase
MRNTTERPEAVEAGVVKLVGAGAAAITENINLLLGDKAVYLKMAQAHNPYGDGTACEKIVEGLELRKIPPVIKLRTGEAETADISANQLVSAAG